jgi:hypothetical protein
MVNPNFLKQETWVGVLALHYFFRCVVGGARVW